MPLRALRPVEKSPLDAWCARALGLRERALTRRKVEEHQLAMLGRTVAWARERSPWYRPRLAGLDPTRWADLPTLPFTTPEELRQAGPGLVCVSQSDIARVVTLQSSGTTGASKRVFFSAAEQEAIVDFFAAGMSTLARRGDRVVVFLPGQTPGSVGALLGTALHRLGVEAVQHGPVRDVAAAVAALASPRPTSLVALPVHALALAEWAQARGLRPTRLRSALLTADHVPAAVARRVARGLGCEVFEHYGMTEQGLGGGVECQAHHGYHLREAELLFEVVDPATGAPLPDGVEGEVVFTTLSRRAMPLVRYRTGDLASLLPGPCACGSVLRRLSHVGGRLGAARVGGLGLPQLDELLLAAPGVVDFRAELAGGALQVTLQALDPAGLQAAERALPDLRQALPGAVLGLACLEGQLTSGPGKRTLAVRDEAVNGP